MATQIRGNTQIKAGTITNAEVASNAAIAFSKLAALTAGYVVLGNGSNIATATQVTGDVTINSSGVTAIGSGVIVNADINASAAIETSKLADGASFFWKNGSVAATGNFDLNSNKIVNLANGSASGDAVNKGQLDAAVALATTGLTFKAPVRVATTTAGTLSTSFENGDTVDGVTLATGDRILIKDQSSGAENGIYTVNASGAPTRATDADTSAEVVAGMFVLVEEGTSNGDSAWVLSTDNDITLGTTALTFTKFMTLADLTAGAGLTKTGNTLDVVSGNGGIVVNTNDITLTVDATADSLSVGSGGIKLKDGTSAQIYVADGSGVFKRVSVSGDVTIGNTGVTAIGSGVIVNADINASAAIALSKLASGTSGQIIVCNGSGVPAYVTMSGDATIDNTGAVTITGGVITSSNFVFNEVPSGTINGSNTAFTLANTPTTGKVTVYLNGLLQKPGGDDYSISSSTITFTTAPETGDSILCNYMK